MDDGCEFARSQEEEARTARVIRKCSFLFNSFIFGLERMTASKTTATFLQDCNLTEMVGSLEDLNNYFVQPEDDLSHEERQKFLKALRNRQDLFQEEGILSLVLDRLLTENPVASSPLNPNAEAWSPSSCPTTLQTCREPSSLVPKDDRGCPGRISNVHLPPASTPLSGSLHFPKSSQQFKPTTGRSIALLPTTSALLSAPVPNSSVLIPARIPFHLVGPCLGILT